MRLRVRVVGLSAGIDPVTEVLRPNGITRCAATRRQRRHVRARHHRPPHGARARQRGDSRQLRDPVAAPRRAAQLPDDRVRDRPRDRRHLRRLRRLLPLRRGRRRQDPHTFAPGGRDADTARGPRGPAARRHDAVRRHHRRGPQLLGRHDGTAHDCRPRRRHRHRLLLPRAAAAQQPGRVHAGLVRSRRDARGDRVRRDAVPAHLRHRRRPPRAARGRPARGTPWPYEVVGPDGTIRCWSERRLRARRHRRAHGADPRHVLGRVRHVLVVDPAAQQPASAARR